MAAALGAMLVACGGRRTRGEGVLNERLLESAARGDAAAVRDALGAGADVDAAARRGFARLAS
ncbi:hypothetical protein ACWEPC_38580 [Nonomuraea sp. NPDC004297]